MKTRTVRTTLLCCSVALVALLGAGFADAAPANSVTIQFTLTTGGGWSVGGWWGIPPAMGPYTITGAVQDSGQAYGENTYYSYPYGPLPPSAMGLLNYDSANGTYHSLSLSVANGSWAVTSGYGKYASATGNGAASVGATAISWNGWVYGYIYTYKLTGTLTLN